MNGIMGLYRSKVNEYLKKNGTYLNIVVDLKPNFLRVCEERIMAGAKKYGDDWKCKNNIKERDDELYDYFNYTILDQMQKDFKRAHQGGKVKKC